MREAWNGGCTCALSMPRLAPVSAFACLALLVAACASETTIPSEAEEGDVASNAMALTATDAVARADQWATAKLHYCQAPNHGRDYDSACTTYCNRQANASWDPYRSDCSGLVSWAWGLPAPGRVTGQFAPFQTDITHAIPATQLRAGDAINNSDHIMLFKQWLIQDKKALFIEEPGCALAQPYAHETTSAVTINGNSISVAENGMTFTAIRYGALAPPVTMTGKLDGAACTGLEGWAQDTAVPTTSLGVLLSFDAAPGKPGAIPVNLTASTKRADLCATIGTACNHGFTIPMPMGARDGKAHTIYAYAVEGAAKTTTLLPGAPKTLTCAAPAFPMDATQGVKRHVTSPAVMGAWKLDAFLDVARETATAVNAYPKAADMPTAPAAVQADDGSPSIWVIDGAIKRHVVDPTSLAAWKLTPTKQPAAKVAALTEGPAWPKERFAFQADGQPDVYVLDVALPAGAGGTPTIGAPAGNGDGTTPGSTTPGSSDPGASDAPSASDGGCSTAPLRSGAGVSWAAMAMGLAGLVLAARRKRS